MKQPENKSSDQVGTTEYEGRIDTLAHMKLMEAAATGEEIGCPKIQNEAVLRLIVRSE